jgi:sensor c-di-GMP phosphodiesterase-like protein
MDDCVLMKPRLAVMFAISSAAVMLCIMTATIYADKLHQQASRSYVETLASKALTRIETVLQKTNQELATLKVRGADSCSVGSLTLMQDFVDASTNIRFVAAATPDSFLCKVPQKQDFITMVSTPVSGSNPLLELSSAFMTTQREPGFLLTRIFPDSWRLSAFVPASVLSLDLLGNEQNGATAFTLGLINGTTIERFAVGEPLTDGTDDATTVTLKSSIFPLSVTVVSKADQLQSYFTRVQWAIIAGIPCVALIIGLIISHFRAPVSSAAIEIERAIAQDEFVPYYQPIVDLKTGRITGCEVLVRWIKPTGEVIPPGAFIGLAEQTGLAIPMTRALMYRVKKDLAKTYVDRPHLKLGFNLFNLHFNDLKIINDVKTVFGRSTIGYDQIVFELTERMPLKNMARAKVVIKKLQELGCKVALDDAGTGHGGLAYLQELGLDIVKIDKMFIDAIGTRRAGESILHSLNELASSLRMSIVAEGVETMEQVEHLQYIGITSAQGYLFAPPLPARSYIALLDAMNPTQYNVNAEIESIAQTL